MRKYLGGIFVAAIACNAACSIAANLGNILPLGDSITQGLNESGSTPGAWRSAFYQAAATAGDTMQFVGTSTATADAVLTAAGQTAHDGWSGYEIDNDPANGRYGIDELFNNSVVGNIPTPNYVLLMIGTNDIDQENATGAGTRYAGLLTDIHTAYPSARIICSSIIPNYDGGDRAVNRLNFNTEIQQDVARDQALGWPVSFVDIGDTVSASTMIDPLHPAQAGDNIIGQGFFDAAVSQLTARHAVDVTSTLTITGTTDGWTNQFDIKRTDFILKEANLAQVTNEVQSGYAGGTWTGEGITSSDAADDASQLTAVGVASGFSETFDGVSLSTGDVIVKCTYYGDANLDGTVDSADYTLIDNGHLSNLTGWQNGDFNYDGVVNGSDYTLIDNAFNRQSGISAASIASVPEPIEVVAVALLGLLPRRRRSQHPPVR